MSSKSYERNSGRELDGVMDKVLIGVVVLLALVALIFFVL